MQSRHLTKGWLCRNYYLTTDFLLLRTTDFATLRLTTTPFFTALALCRFVGAALTAGAVNAKAKSARYKKLRIRFKVSPV
jgi:hypothetical protein